jgi:hypothetical protein
MFMGDNKKKMTTLILDKMKGDSTKPVPMKDGGEIDNSIGIDSASEEIMSAIEKKDVKALTSALKSFMDMCYEEEGESPEKEASEQEPQE